MKKCDFCQEERPDDNISVKKRATIVDGVVAGEETRRFCIDKPSCRQKATKWWAE